MCHLYAVTAVALCCKVLVARFQKANNCAKPSASLVKWLYGSKETWEAEGFSKVGTYLPESTASHHRRQ